ncbi:hypothetical protein EON64_06565 [archaeon]|nr:MAG: hypothetical protein EON64_06565 [archaeon]
MPISNLRISIHPPSPSSSSSCIRSEQLKKHLSAQESIFSSIRAEEQSLTNALNNAQKQCTTVQTQKSIVEVQVLDYQQQLKDSQSQLKDLAKKNEELTSRCSELVKQSAAERKAR